MSQNKPIIKQSLADKANERDKKEAGRAMSTVSGGLVNLCLIISAVLTIIYLMLIVEEATGLPSPYGYLLGLLVGIVAVMPAEMALTVWRSRLNSDHLITGGQRNTAVIAIILAGLFSAATTSSFFSYFLPHLFPPSFLAIAPSINVGAIVGSWITFLLAVVAYDVFSRQTQQNLAQAKANQGIFDARMDVLRSAGEAIREEAEKLINDMDEGGIFGEDALRLILNALGMGSDRLEGIDTPQPGRPKQLQGNGRKELTAPPRPEPTTKQEAAEMTPVRDEIDEIHPGKDDDIIRRPLGEFDILFREDNKGNGRPTQPQQPFDWD